MSVCLILLTMNKTNIGLLFAILEGLQYNTYYIHNNIQCKYNILNFLYTSCQMFVHTCSFFIITIFHIVV